MKEYIIHNRTDGIMASMYSYKTKEEAEQKIDQMREMFRRVQGYYTTSNRERIDPNDVIYEIIEIDREDEEENDPYDTGDTMLNYDVETNPDR